MTESLNPILAFDIFPEAESRPVTEAWPGGDPAAGALWRWIHCDRTTEAFARWSAGTLPAPVRDALLRAETRPQADLVANGLLVVLRGMNLNPGEDEEDMVAIRLWAAGHLVVSTRLRRIVALDGLRADFEAGHGLPSAGALLARLADLLTAPIEESANELEDRTDDIEEQLLDTRHDDLGAMGTSLARLARSVLKIRRHMAPQRDAMTRLAALDTPLIGAADRYALRGLAGRTTRVVEELDGVRERLTSLRGLIDSLTSARQVRNGYVLSIVAAVFLPLGFLTGLFGVNLGGIPGTDSPFGFLILTAALVAVGAAVWAALRWLRWL